MTFAIAALDNIRLIKEKSRIYAQPEGFTVMTHERIKSIFYTISR